MATEELVRREEQLAYEERLHQAKNEWFKEREIILEDRKTHELQEIAKEKNLLTETLLLQFEKNKHEIEDVNQKRLDGILEETWKKAQEIRDESEKKAREEEKKIAAEIVAETFQQVILEREQERLKQQELLKLTLLEQKETLIDQCSKEKEKLEKQLNKEHDNIVKEILANHENETIASQQVYYDLVLENNDIKEQLRIMMNERDYWKKHYEDTKEEFSDFIDHIPGFKGDFLIK